MIKTADTVVFSQDWHPENHKSFASTYASRAPYEEIEMPYGPQILWPDHCVIGTKGAEFHPKLNSNQAQMIVRKGFRAHVDSYSAFFENDKQTTTGLDGYLKSRGIQAVTIVGLALDFCVYFSAMDARALGYEVTVVKDACRPIDLDGSLEKAMNDMKSAGVVIE